MLNIKMEHRSAPLLYASMGGASVLVGNNLDNIRKEFKNTFKLDRNPSRPELWDGHTAERIVKILVNTNLIQSK